MQAHLILKTNLFNISLHFTFASLTGETLLCPAARRLIFLDKFCRRSSIARFPNGTAIAVPHGPPNFNHTNLFVDKKLKIVVSAKPSVAAMFWRMLHAAIEGRPPKQLHDRTDMQVRANSYTKRKKKMESKGFITAIHAE